MVKTLMDLRRLVDEVTGISGEPGMQRLRGLWEAHHLFQAREFVPVTVSMSQAFWSRMLGMSLIEVYEKPEKMLELELKQKVYRYRLFRDDLPIDQGVGISFGNAWEASLLGVKPVFQPETDPWPGGGSDERPVVRDKRGLDSLVFPDFYKSGLMPRVHVFYEKIRGMVGPDIPVSFPGPHRGLWGLVNDLRGMKQVIVDTRRNPDIVHRLMSYVTEYRMRYEKERAAFLGTRVPSVGTIGNDEVNCNVISPRIYGEFIYPYERRLAEFYEEGLFYYHSCGNLTPLLEKISTLKGVRKVHVSPWTDFETAVKRLGGRVILQRRLHPVEDVLLRSVDEMRATLSRVREIGEGEFMEVDAGAFQTGPLEKIQAWIRVARDVFKSAGPEQPIHEAPAHTPGRLPDILQYT